MFLFGLLLCAAPRVASAGAVYISTLGGASDSNSGSSVDSPWRHLSKVAGFVLPPGTDVLLERGSVFEDETLELMLPSGMTLGAYGNSTLPRPQIVRRTLPGTVTCVELVDPADVAVSGLHVAGCAQGIRISASTAGNAGGGSRNVTIADNFFRDITAYDALFNPSASSWGAAIALVSGFNITGVTIQNNVGLRMDTFLLNAAYLDGMLFRANTMYACGGNCVQMVRGRGLRLEDSVFLKDTPARYFMYGTTDVIIGSVVGDNSITGCDFNSRGEYPGGPDGCAIDFETGATGFNISDNSIYKSYGGGIMVFGHDKTSHDITLSFNNFLDDGCMQPRDDRAGIAFMCPNGVKPDGFVKGNRFVTCEGVPAMYDTPNVPNCSEHMVKTDNRINDGLSYIPEPQVTFNPTGPGSTDPTTQFPVLCAPPIKNSIVRYTTDGSRPTESSPAMPEKGLMLAFPGPALVVNVRAFPTDANPDVLPSITNGVVIERYVYRARGVSGGMPGEFKSSLDGVVPGGKNGGLTVRGWAVDTSTEGAGRGPVSVEIKIDGASIGTFVANTSRPDLVKAKIAPDPMHGFEVPLSPKQVSELAKGFHTVDVMGTGTLMTAPRRRVEKSPACICDGAVCDCMSRA